MPDIHTSKTQRVSANDDYTPFNERPEQRVDQRLEEDEEDFPWTFYAPPELGGDIIGVFDGDTKFHGKDRPEFWNVAKAAYQNNPESIVGVTDIGFLTKIGAIEKRSLPGFDPEP